MPSNVIVKYFLNSFFVKNCPKIRECKKVIPIIESRGHAHSAKRPVLTLFPVWCIFKKKLRKHFCFQRDNNWYLREIQQKCLVFYTRNVPTTNEVFYNCKIGFYNCYLPTANWVFYNCKLSLSVGVLAY